MKLGLIVGSHRKDSQSTRMGGVVNDRWKELTKTNSDGIFTLDFGKTQLPMWDESFYDKNSDLQKVWEPFSKRLIECEAFVVISPEWHGMVPAALKNFFLFAGTKELGHKPAMIFAVSSGRGGSYPVVELRMSSYKNTRLLYVPDHMIVREVESIFNSPEPRDANEASLRARLDNNLKLLYEYGKALKQVRESGVIDWKSFPSGL